MVRQDALAALSGQGLRRDIHAGPCSWTDPALIKARTFYPKGCSSAEARLRHYASRSGIVEVDSSWFALPAAATTALWVERTPAAFRLLTGHALAEALLARLAAA